MGGKKGAVNTKCLFLLSHVLGTKVPADYSKVSTGTWELRHLIFLSRGLEIAI